MTGLNAGPWGLPEDPQALRGLLYSACKPADSDGVEVLELVVEAYARWRRVGQRRWGAAGGAVEVWQGSRVRRAAARHLGEQLLELWRYVRGRRGRAAWPPVEVPLATCVAPGEAWGPWAWAEEAGVLEQQLLDRYRPRDPVEALALALVAQAYVDAQYAQGWGRERGLGLCEEWLVQALRRRAARHLGEMLRVLQHLQAGGWRPKVTVVGVRPAAGPEAGPGAGWALAAEGPV